MSETELHPGVHKFQLTDAKGQPHTYIVNEHPAGEGMAIMFALVGLGAPTVLGLAGAAIQSERLLGAVVDVVRGKTDDETDDDDWKDFAGMAVGLDLPSVGREVGLALATGKAPELTKKVLARTFRDGKPLLEVFDQAYQANYFELLEAVFRVCRINQFFPVPSTSGSSESPTEAAASTPPSPAPSAPSVPPPLPSTPAVAWPSG